MTENAAKTNELNGKGIEKIQYIKPYYQNDSEVLKITDAKGETKYCGYYSKKELRTCDDELELKLLCLLEPLEVLENALAYEGYHYHADTLTVIRQNLTNKIDEIFKFVNSNIGVIKIYEICEIVSGRPHRWGQCVDAKLSPPDTSEGMEEGPIFNHDPELVEYLKQIPPDKTETIRTIMRHIRSGNNIQFQVIRGQ